MGVGIFAIFGVVLSKPLCGDKFGDKFAFGRHIVDDGFFFCTLQCSRYDICLSDYTKINIWYCTCFSIPYYILHDSRIYASLK